MSQEQRSAKETAEFFAEATAKTREAKPSFNLLARTAQSPYPHRHIRSRPRHGATGNGVEFVHLD